MNDLRATYAGKEVVISGGLGFIGSNLAIRLVGLGARVCVIDLMTESDGGNLFNIDPIKDDVEVHIHDAADQNKLDDLIRGKDFLFNLAGKTSHIDSMEAPAADLHANVATQIAQLEACRRHNRSARVIFASTRQIYGKPKYLPVDESHPVQPVDVNGIHKHAAESLHELYHRVYGLRTTSLRLTNTYGARQLLSHNRLGFTGWFLGLALRNLQIQLYGDGLQQRDFTHVDDVTDAFLRVAACEESVGQVLNVGNPEQISLLEFVRTLIHEAGTGSYRLVPFPDDKKRIDVGDIYCRIDRIHQLTGWTPRVSLRAGLSQTLAYYRENGRHYLPA